MGQTLHSLFSLCISERFTFEIVPAAKTRGMNVLGVVPCVKPQLVLVRPEFTQYIVYVDCATKLKVIAPSKEYY